MNKELINLLTERIELLRVGSSVAAAGEASNTLESAAAQKPNDEEPLERNETDGYVETVVVDFDFDEENQTNFHRFMNLRYFWVDWSDVITDIY